MLYLQIDDEQSLYYNQASRTSHPHILSPSYTRTVCWYTKKVLEWEKIETATVITKKRNFLQI